MQSFAGENRIDRACFAAFTVALTQNRSVNMRGIETGRLNCTRSYRIQNYGRIPIVAQIIDLEVLTKHASSQYF